MFSRRSANTLGNGLVARQHLQTEYALKMVPGIDLNQRIADLQPFLVTARLRHAERHPYGVGDLSENLKPGTLVEGTRWQPRRGIGAGPSAVLVFVRWLRSVVCQANPLFAASAMP